MSTVSPAKRRRTSTNWWMIAAVVAVAVLAVWFVGRGSDPASDASSSTSSRPSSSSTSTGGDRSRPTKSQPGRASTTTTRPTRPTSLGTDPHSGLRWIAESALNRQAADTLRAIRAGGPFRFPRNDDVTYFNNNRILPTERRGYYREYTVVTPGASNRGARRIVVGAEGELYYTDDHYDSFVRIKERR